MNTYLWSINFILFLEFLGVVVAICIAGLLSASLWERYRIGG